MYRYLYKLGHQPYVSVLELKRFITLEGSLKAGDLGKFAQSNQEIGISNLGGTISRLKVLAESSEKSLGYATFLRDTIAEYSKENKLNKVGIFSNVDLNKAKMIQTCKQLGAKKINVLDRDVFPSIGHIKSALTWFALIRIKGEMLCAVIEEYSDQEHWQELDRRLPHKDMKRGIMNLKLSRILMNLTSDGVIWDPFCGLGRTLVGGLRDKSELIGSDRDGHILLQAQENLDTAFAIESSKLSNLTKPHIKLFSHDVTKPINHTLLPESGYSIVTEGYLGPALSVGPDDVLLRKLFWETKHLWTAFFQNLSMSSVKDIIFCIPAYKINGKFETNKEFIELLTTLIPTHTQSSYYQDIYARKDAVVGHQILVLNRK